MIEISIALISLFCLALASRKIKNKEEEVQTTAFPPSTVNN
jgi:hypothetical protein